MSIPDTITYEAMRGVPNFVFAVGYTNASWTLKVEITCEYLCRLLRYGCIDDGALVFGGAVSAHR